MHGVDGNLSETEVSYQEGVADFNNNYQVPVEGEPYLLVSVTLKNGVDKYRYMGIKGNKF